MSEHKKNMSVLATSKTSDGFWQKLCNPVFFCGSWGQPGVAGVSSSCRKPVRHQMNFYKNLFDQFKGLFHIFTMWVFWPQYASNRLGCSFLRVVWLFLASLQAAKQSLIQTTTQKSLFTHTDSRPDTEISKNIIDISIILKQNREFVFLKYIFWFL